MIFSQYDPQWANDTLGFNPDNQGWTIGNYGCAITSIAMMLTQWGFNTNPRDINQRLKNVDGYKANTGLIIWEKVGWIFPNVEFVTIYDYSKSKVNELLNKNYSLILYLDGNVNTSPWEDHYTYVNGTDSIFDPWGGVERNFAYYKGKIKSILAYKLTIPIAMEPIPIQVPVLQINQDDMLKEQIKQTILNQKYDSSTEKALLDSLEQPSQPNGVDVDYLLKFSGKVIRDGAIRTEQELNDLKINLSQLESNLVDKQLQLNQTLDELKQAKEKVSWDKALIGLFKNGGLEASISSVATALLTGIAIYIATKWPSEWSLIATVLLPLAPQLPWLGTILNRASTNSTNKK